MQQVRKRRPERLVVVHCPECDAPRHVSRSWARRMTSVCEDCANPAKRDSVRKRNMRFWLSRYDDDEIAWMAAVIHDLPLRPDLVAKWRKRLLPLSSK